MTVSLPGRVLNRLGRPFGINPFPRAFENPLSGGVRTAPEVFDEIYRQNYWGSGESRSGTGSERSFTTGYRRRLHRLLQERGLPRIFDAPCGDMNWMVEMLDGSSFAYRGGDISSEVITSARAAHPGLDLCVFDITRDPFPDADVWHCRDCLLLLPFTAIRQALENFVDSSIPHALITSHKARLLHKNLDVGLGGFRFLDLQRAPFFLPAPIGRIPDFVMGREFPRYVCLWSRQQIAAALTGDGI